MDSLKKKNNCARGAAEKLGVEPSECVVVEDSAIGLAAATGAGMRCVITYTPSTESQDFSAAEAVVKDLGEFASTFTVGDLAGGGFRQDDRAATRATFFP